MYSRRPNNFLRYVFNCMNNLAWQFIWAITIGIRLWIVSEQLSIVFKSVYVSKSIFDCFLTGVRWFLQKTVSSSRSLRWLTLRRSRPSWQMKAIRFYECFLIISILYFSYLPSELLTLVFLFTDPTSLPTECWATLTLETDLSIPVSDIVSWARYIQLYFVLFISIFHPWVNQIRESFT